MKRSRTMLLTTVALAGIAGTVATLFYHRTACYGSHLAIGDWEYGWPFRYGFDQDDVAGELLWTLSSFHPIAFAADAIIGLAVGVIGGLTVVRCVGAWSSRRGHSAGALVASVVAVTIWSFAL